MKLDLAQASEIFCCLALQFFIDIRKSVFGSFGNFVYQETPMEDGELKLFIEQCVKFSRGDLLTGMSLWSQSMWTEFAEKYNELALAKNLSLRSWSEMIQAGRGLQSEFCNQRKVHYTLMLFF